MTRQQINLRGQLRDSASPGISIVELLVAVAIMGGLAGMSVATFHDKVGKEELKSITREGVSWIEDVKKHAIQYDTPCEINIDILNQEFTIPEQNSANLLHACTTTSLSKLSLKASLNNAAELEICSAILNQGESPTDELSTLTSLVCSQTTVESSENISTVFSPRGTLTRSLLITLNLPAASQSRCIALQAPNSMIRSGKVIGESCDFTTAL